MDPTASKEQQLIEHIIRSHDPGAHGSLAQYLARELDKRRRVIRKRNELENEKCVLERAYEYAHAELRDKSVALTRECRHWSVSHFRDPSGGSDSHEQCNDCGLEAVTIPVGGEP